MLHSVLFIALLITNKPNRKSNLGCTEGPLAQKVRLLSESLMLLSLPSPLAMFDVALRPF